VLKLKQWQNAAWGCLWFAASLNSQDLSPCLHKCRNLLILSFLSTQFSNHSAGNDVAGGTKGASPDQHSNPPQPTDVTGG